MSLNVSVCDSLPALEALHGEWESLLERADNANIFFTWDWVDVCWRYGFLGKQPFVLIAREQDERLVGLLPLAGVPRFKLLRTLEVLGCDRSGYPVGDYGGVIAERGSESEVWAAMLRHLKKVGKWSVIDLRNVKVRGQVTDDGRWTMDDGYRSLAAGPGLSQQVVQADVCRVLDLPGTYDGYLGGLSANGRQNIRRKMRKLADAGVVIERVDALDDSARNTGMEALFNLHQERWSKLGMGGFPNEESRGLHRRIAERLALLGRLDLRVARTAEGQIIGAISNFRHDEVAYFHSIGLSQDPRWASYSLGVCLLADSIRAAIGDGCHTFDLLRGDHDYKRHFGGYITRNLRVTLYRYGWLPKAEAFARSLRGRLSSSDSKVQSSKSGEGAPGTLDLGHGTLD